MLILVSISPGALQERWNGTPQHPGFHWSLRTAQELPDKVTLAKSKEIPDSERAALISYSEVSKRIRQSA
jgi:hypothetical protein